LRSGALSHFTFSCGYCFSQLGEGPSPAPLEIICLKNRSEMGVPVGAVLSWSWCGCL